MDSSGQTISWQVATHIEREHTTDWYWAIGVATLVGAAASIYFGDLMLAFILVVGMGSIALLSARGPREHLVNIDRRGISVDGTLYPYPTVQSFWVDVAEDESGEPSDLRPAHLFLTTRALVLPHVMIPLDSAAHATMVRDYLAQFVDEVEQHPHLGENIADILGLW